MNGLGTMVPGLESTLLLESLIAGSVLVLLAHGITRLLSRRAAAIRHLVWALALGALAVWPVMEMALPVWATVPVLVTQESPGEAFSAQQAAPPPAGDAVSPREGGAALPPRSAAASAAPSAAPAATVATVGATSGFESAGSVGGRFDVGSAPRTSASSATGSTRSFPALRNAPWSLILLAVWLSGVAGMLTLLAVSVLARRKVFLRDAVPLGGDGWERALEAARVRVGVRGSLRLLSGPHARVPATWGVVRPVVLMPESASSWPESQRRAALVHELAHVRRRDHFTQTLGWVAVALHWFNPLVWHAQVRLRAEAEHACDDLALTSGERPSEYASGLLSVAARLTGRPLFSPATVAMARRPDLGHRLEAILDAERNRAAASRVWVAGAVLATVFLTVPLAALGPRRSAPPAMAEAPEDIAVVRPHLAEAGELGEAGEEADRIHEDREQAWSQALDRARAATERFSSPASASPFGTQEFQACVPSTDGGGIREVTNGRNGRIMARWDLDHCSVTVRIDRVVDFGRAEDRVASISSDGRFELSQEGPGPDREVRVTAGADGAPVYDYRLDGDRAEMDDAARAWLAEMIPAIYRVTGLNVKERFARLLDAGGTAAIVEEVRHIHSDHVAAQYLGLLLRSGELSDDETRQVFVSAGERIESDHELGQLLRNAWRPGLSDATRSAFLESARTIESDHELGQVIRAFLKEAPTTAEAAAIVVLARDIESDHELAQVLNAVMTRAEADAALRREVLETAQGIESDYELSQILIRLAKNAGPEVLESELFLDLVRGISSDYELGQTLALVIRHPDLEESGMMEIVELSTRIESDYEQAELLSLLIRQHSRLPESVSDRVVEVAQTLSSDYERDRVISLLVRSSR